jgi:hypothetical protein
LVAKRMVLEVPSGKLAGMRALPSSDFLAGSPNTRKLAA